MGKTDKDLPWKVYYERNGEDASMFANGGAWHTKFNRRKYYKGNRTRAHGLLREVRKGDHEVADTQAVAESRHRNSIRYDWW